MSVCVFRRMNIYKICAGIYIFSTPSIKTIILPTLEDINFSVYLHYIYFI